MTLSWMISMTFMLGACLNTHYQAVERIIVDNQVVVFLEAFPEEGTPADLHTKIINRSEAALRSLLGEKPRFVTRQQFVKRWENEPQPYQQYQILSDSLSRLDLNSPELVRTLATKIDADWLVSVQFMIVRCLSCQIKAQAMLVGQIVESKTNQILFRTVLQEKLPADLSEQEAVGYDLLEQFLEGLRFSMSEKWQLKRFDSLRSI